MNRLSLMGLALFLSFSLAQAGDILDLSKAQIDALGLQFAAPQRAESVSGPAWSGSVMLPPDGYEQIVAPLPGRIVRVHAAAGDAVVPNQPLVTLYSPALVQLVQDYQRARASEDLAGQTLSREQRLTKEGIGVERRVREAEIALRQTRIEREALSARLDLAGVSAKTLSNPRTTTAEVILRAPRAGKLLMLDAQPGAWLNEGEVATALSYTSIRWIEAEVPLEQADTLKAGQSARILPGELSGTVLAVGLTADPARQTVAVRVEVQDGEALRFGQRAQARFTESGMLWRVPRSAVVQIDGHDSIFVRRADAILPLSAKQRGHEADAALIEAALQAADQIVTQGAIALKGTWQAREGQ